jgi:hypothetical protein
LWRLAALDVCASDLKLSILYVSFTFSGQLSIFTLESTSIFSARREAAKSE